MTILGENGGAHILVIPYPAQGHMLSLLDLTHHLATRGLTVTILVTPKNLPLLNPLLSNHTTSSIKPLVLPFPPHPSIPSGVENAKDLPGSSTPLIIKALGDLRDPLIHWFNSHPSPPVAIISDMFLGWSHHLASQLGIRRIVFSPSGALALSEFYSLWRRMPEVEDINASVSFPEIPSCPKYHWWQVSPLFRSYSKGDPVSEFVKDGFYGNMSSWGLVVNSFTQLEGVYLDHLKKELGHDRVWAVGPLLPPNADANLSGPIERGGSSSVAVDHIAAWLDACEDRRVQVAYVCFGSHAVLTNGQMEALASALEKSGVHFIWSVKEPTVGHVDGKYGEIPPGFEDRVAGRGLVIKGWAPQVLILSHPAVGSFMTHCGWNSTVEGLVAGVTFLAWPMGAEQFANAGLLVDELKVGIRVCEGPKTVPNSDQLAELLAESVRENRVERERAKELREAALEALKEGGGSVKDLDGLVKHLVGLRLEATNLGDST